LRAQLPEIVAEVHRAPADAAAREGLKRKLAGLRDDAELIGDAELVEQADAALKELESGGRLRWRRRSSRSPTRRRAAPEISEETQRLLGTDASQLDAELLEIYLTEAPRCSTPSASSAPCSSATTAIAKRLRSCAASSTR
jgi:hypothetical protein